MTSAIPIRNLYALLAFHWYELGLEGLTDVGAVDADTPLELLARLLVHGTRTQLRRGIHREYREHAEDLARPRGAIDVTTTVQRALLRRHRLHCRYDELVPDLPVNRLIKASLRALTTAEIEPDTRRAVTGLALRLAEVSDVPLLQAAAASLTIPRGSRTYAVLVEICRMLARHLLPDAGDGGHRFRDVLNDDDELARLFEGFVRGFARWHLRGRAEVRCTQPIWAGFAGPDDARALLPRMKTDCTILTHEVIAVLECKFVREPFRRIGDSDARLKLRSSHLYQLFAYVTNLARTHVDREIRGTLVYASAGDGVDTTFRLGNTELTVRTVDLTLPWADLQRVMSALVTDAAGGAARSTACVFAPRA